MQIKSIATLIALAFAGSALAAPTHYNVSPRNLDLDVTLTYRCPFQTFNVRDVDVSDIQYEYCNDLDPSSVAKKNKPECTKVKQPLAKAAVDRVLAGAREAGVPIAHDQAVKIINNFHESDLDKEKHVTFIFTDPHLCPHPYTWGKTNPPIPNTCVGHGYDPEETKKYEELKPGTIYSGKVPIYIPGKVVSWELPSLAYPVSYAFTSIAACASRGRTCIVYHLRLWRYMLYRIHVDIFIILRGIPTIENMGPDQCGFCVVQLSVDTRQPRAASHRSLDAVGGHMNRDRDDAYTHCIFISRLPRTQRPLRRACTYH